VTNIIASGVARKVVYGIYALLSLGTGALHVFFSAVGLPDPSWLVGATAVIAFLASAPLTLALVNVFAPENQTASAPAPAPVEATPEPAPTQPAA